MLPLDGCPVLEHDIRRARAADAVDEVVVATTFHRRDDLVVETAESLGATVYRGSEDDVLGRMWNAAAATDADVVVRLTGDNPFVPPELISAEIRLVADGSLDYASNKVSRTWPIGADAEAFTFESFTRVESAARDPHHREHVTPYYHEHDDEFDMANVTVEDVYGDRTFDAGTELRLTLDEVDDYLLYDRIYKSIAYDELIDIHDVVEYIRTHGLQEENADVEQRTGW
jgi:spore coat polysaccharide biosynthesis protein SpsF